MAEQEANAISHLLEVESQANELIKAAQIDADKRLTSARSEADSKFKSVYTQIVSRHEADCKSKIEALDTKYRDDVAAYKEYIKTTEQDEPAFNKFVESVLFSK